MTVTAEQWRAYGQQFVDQHYAYCIDCDRCGGSCHCLDCSGMQCRISNGLGLTHNLCTTSFVMAQQCWDLGLYMTAEVAEADSGPDVFWAFHGANYGRTDDGSRPNGASGHIVTVVRVRDANGHTTGFYTEEAMGHAYGVVNGKYEGRGWTGRYRIPGVVSGPPPSTFHPERTMIVQQYHYNRNGDAQRIPDRIPATKSDGSPHPRAGAFVCCTIGPSADGKGLVLKDGASFIGAGKKDFADDYWPSPDVAAHGRILSCTRISPKDSPQILVIKHEDREQITHRLT